MRANAEVGVYCADTLQNGRVVRQAAAGPRSNLLDLGIDLSARGAIILAFQRLLHASGEIAGNLVDLGGALGANVELGMGLRGNGVDAGAAVDDPEVV